MRRLVENLADTLVSLVVPKARAQAASCTWGAGCKCVPNAGSGLYYRYRYCVNPDGGGTTVSCVFYTRGC
ncbi:hypothetical protein [Bailinhaonella thermotolerans]|uniref:Uncharacterized protein n=1 Tax=Bailinhaonella thermotolerans TaxID=1070861 RepID=A0A3A4B5V5_9ACTN|nr:hypothetical protein [Bailinhaonella thermotolerans]RJL36010.1 hypothetical protein D5H75_04425 [Bailinhaonella thermotolerans]